jgi:hypothetical protein
MSSRGEGLTLARTAIVGVLILIAASLLLAWCVVHGYSIDEQAKAVGITKDILTIVALALGGFWSLRIYIKQRSDAFAIDVKQNVVVIKLSTGNWLLKVIVAIRNVGKIRVQLSEWRYRAELLIPTPESEVAEVPTRAFSEVVAPWETLAEAKLAGDEFGFFIEPGATQVESANIILPAWVQAVQVYSFFSEPTDPTRGWWDRTIVDLREESAHGHRTTATTFQETTAE